MGARDGGGGASGVRPGSPNSGSLWASVPRHAHTAVHAEDIFLGGESPLNVLHSTWGRGRHGRGARGGRGGAWPAHTQRPRPQPRTPLGQGGGAGSHRAPCPQREGRAAALNQGEMQFSLKSSRSETSSHRKWGAAWPGGQCEQTRTQPTSGPSLPERGLQLVRVPQAPAAWVGRRPGPVGPAGTGPCCGAGPRGSRCPLKAGPGALRTL